MSKRYVFLFVAIIFGTMLWSGCSENQTKEASSEIQNPILPGDRPDPTVIQIGDTYWASATSNEWSPLFPIFKSTDLQNWELVSYVFPEGAPDWARNNFWAPELAYDEEQGKVYAYYTARDKESDRLSVAVASADSPEGPYTDHGALVAQELGSIDAYEVRDLDGTLYMLWKEDGNSRGEPTPMWAQQINEERTKLLSEKIELFRNDEEWEAHLIEGVSVFRENDYFYAVYSAGSCCDVACDYRTGVARAENLLGPWEKYEGNPTLTNNDDWKCTGHGSVAKKDGDYYYLYHAYSRDGSVYVGREAVLEKFVWTEDGWPVFENDAEYNRSRGAWDFSDNFSGDELNLLWQWRVTQDIEFETGSNGLIIHASRENEDLGTLLVQQTRSPDYDISAVIDVSNSDENAKGGVALVGAANNGFGAPVAAIGISAQSGEVEVWETRNRETTIMETASLDGSSETVELSMSVKDGYMLTFSITKSDGKEVVAENIDASHLVPWGMGFRFGLTAKGENGAVINFKEFNSINY
ncbi:MAG: family 43 glycosylhydrolase [Gracilimonas sp.]|uniref:family 43 glycosylhydrolase n=1 Tax=Gracilimonas sp. TaxID=1974203 RepID=UPI0019B3CEAD|nr:family 43 glycosylhydrolase [Gracilimonas sp.]MBD3617357.1 family 43 glycosylhydrolase [Gracilimonas sp.]